MVIERVIPEILYVIHRMSKFPIVQAWFYGKPLKL
jgi:hypothetical protein